MKHYKEERTCKHHGPQVFRVYAGGGHCPVCERESYARWVAANPDKFRTAQRRYDKSEKGKATRARYRADPEKAEAHRKATRAWLLTARGKESLARSRLRVTGRVCRWCGRTDAKKGFGALAAECATCNRRGTPSRNGRHKCCGEPTRKNKPHECKT